MEKSLISIIIPMYNSEKYISRCLESIIGQTYSALEIIVIDDGSTDNSFSICNEIKKRDSRIKIYRKNNEGQGIARNFGLELCSGDFIAFVDADDWVDENLYKKMIDLMRKYDSDVVEVGSHVVDKYKLIKDVKTPEIRVIEKSENILLDFLYNGMKYSMAGYPVWNKLYKKQCFENHSFNKISRHEDYLINFQIYQNINKIVITSEKLYYYYQHFESTTKGYLELNDLLMIDNCKRVYQESLITNNNHIIKLAKAKVARCYFSCLCKAVFVGVFDEITKDISKDLFGKVKKSFFLLISSPMAISRKFALLFLIFDSYIPIKKIKYISKKEVSYECEN